MPEITRTTSILSAISGKKQTKKNFHKATRVTKVRVTIVTKIEAQVKHKYVIFLKICLHAKNMTLNIVMLTNI